MCYDLKEAFEELYGPLEITIHTTEDTRVRDLEEKVDLLMNHLGLEICTIPEKTVVIEKKQIEVDTPE